MKKMIMRYKLIKSFVVNYKLILILILATILRFYNLDFQSPWLDEIHSLNESNPNISIFDLYERIKMGEQLPPLYFYILYFIFKLFGYSIAVARGFSALLGVITVYSCFLLTKELINKRTALVAALFMCVNYYMIFYSQEARPYMLFTLFMLFSYYRMVLFIKSHSTKNAVWYGVAACFMIHSHFVGFFTLFAQFVALILYFILKEGVNRKQLLKGGTIAAVVLLILYIPAFDALISLSDIKSFWIRPLAEDGLTLIYTSFFGKSEIIIVFNLIFYFGFVYWLFEQGKSNIKKTGEKLAEHWVSIILILWISLTLLIPLIRTYTSVPMILGRYLIAILPAIIIILAIGVTHIKNNFLSATLVALYSIFTLVFIFFIKDYYVSVKKAQFRESTSYIMERNSKNHKVVTSLPVYLPYFFQKENKNYDIINSDLNVFIEDQAQKKRPIKAFWYFDGHNRKYNPKKETIEFLKKNYIIQDSYTGFQAWTRHYVVKEESNIKVEFTQAELTQLLSMSQIKSYVEKFNFEQNHLSVKGWAIFKNVNSKNTEIRLMLFNNQTGYLIETTDKIRSDVTAFLKLDYNADYSGFETNMDLDYIPKGNYLLGIWLKNDVENINGLFLYKEEIKIQ